MNRERLIEQLEEARARTLHLVEPLTEECCQPAIQLDGRHHCACVEQAAGQQAEARPDLEDPPARPGVRLGEDGVEHIGIGQEVLR